MEIGIIGLGKMGLNLALNLTDHGHKVIGYDSYAAMADGAGWGNHRIGHRTIDAFA